MSDTIISTINQGLREILELPAEQQIPADAHLKNDLGIDSISSMDLLMYLEDNIDGFTVKADTLEARHFNTPNTMSEYIVGELAPLSVETPKTVNS